METRRWGDAETRRWGEGETASGGGSGRGRRWPAGSSPEGGGDSSAKGNALVTGASQTTFSPEGARLLATEGAGFFRSPQALRRGPRRRATDDTDFTDEGRACGVGGCHQNQWKTPGLRLFAPICVICHLWLGFRTPFPSAFIPVIRGSRNLTAEGADGRGWGPETNCPVCRLQPARGRCGSRRTVPQSRRDDLFIAAVVQDRPWPQGSGRFGRSSPRRSSRRWPCFRRERAVALFLPLFRGWWLPERRFL